MWTHLTVIFFIIINSSGYSPRKPIPLHKMPSASNDFFTWKMDDGSYQFGMQGKDQWRVEKRYPNGAVFVRFAYRTPDGQVQDSSFTVGTPPQTAPRNEMLLTETTTHESKSYINNSNSKVAPKQLQEYEYFTGNASNEEALQLQTKKENGSSSEPFEGTLKVTTAKSINEILENNLPTNDIQIDIIPQTNKGDTAKHPSSQESNVDFHRVFKASEKLRSKPTTYNQRVKSQSEKKPQNTKRQETYNTNTKIEMPLYNPFVKGKTESSSLLTKYLLESEAEKMRRNGKIKEISSHDEIHERINIEEHGSHSEKKMQGDQGMNDKDSHKISLLDNYLMEIQSKAKRNGIRRQKIPLERQYKSILSRASNVQPEIKPKQPVIRDDKGNLSLLLVYLGQLEVRQKGNQSENSP